jgi:hypothetical protein
MGGGGNGVGLLETAEGLEGSFLGAGPCIQWHERVLGGLLRASWRCGANWIVASWEGLSGRTNGLGGYNVRGICLVDVYALESSVIACFSALQIC